MQVRRVEGAAHPPVTDAPSAVNDPNFVADLRAQLPTLRRRKGVLDTLLAVLTGKPRVDTPGPTPAPPSLVSPKPVSGAHALSDGPRRLQQELRALLKQLPEGCHDLRLVDDDLTRWEVKLSLTDGALAADLQTYKRHHGDDKVTLRLNFPTTYPADPPFVWMLSPRLQLQTGFVSRGAICLEMLTHSGSSYAWRSDYTVAAVLNTILLNFQDPSANGRIDRPCVRSAYTEAEALAGLQRAKKNHNW